MDWFSFKCPRNKRYPFRHLEGDQLFAILHKLAWVRVLFRLLIPTCVRAPHIVPIHQLNSRWTLSPLSTTQPIRAGIQSTASFRSPPVISQWPSFIFNNNQVNPEGFRSSWNKRKIHLKYMRINLPINLTQNLASLHTFPFTPCRTNHFQQFITAHYLVGFSQWKWTFFSDFCICFDLLKSLFSNWTRGCLFVPVKDLIGLNRWLGLSSVCLALPNVIMYIISLDECLYDRKVCIRGTIVSSLFFPVSMFSSHTYQTPQILISLLDSVTL